MAIVQISKIQVRTGNESDLPQLDIGELGFTTDTKKVYVGNDPLLDPPIGIQPTLTQILTDSPNCYINASQITGVYNIRIGDLKISGGQNGYVLVTDGTGNLSWSAAGGGGGSGSPHGVDTQVQFNDSGSFGSTSNLTFDKVSKTLTVDNLVATNITGNITLTSNSQPNITSLGTLISANVTGNIKSGNANLGNLAIANYFSGNGSLLTSITADTAGTVTTASQPNITDVGTLNELTVSGVTRLGVIGNVKITGGTTNQVLVTDGQGNLSWATVSGTGSMFGNLDVQTFMNANYIPNFTGIIGNARYALNAGNAYSVLGSNVSGAVSSATTAGTVTTAAQPNITSTGTLTSLSVTGNITTGNVDGANLITSNYFVGNGSRLTSLNGANVTGVVANATYAVSSGSAGSATVVPWTGVSSTPTTISGYGITDAYGHAFIATIATGQPVPTSPNLNVNNLLASISALPLIYDDVSFNIGAGYNNATGVFTAPRTGFYQVSADVCVAPADNQLQQVFNYISHGALVLYKNTTQIASGPYLELAGVVVPVNGGYVAAGVFDASSVSTLVRLNQGETLHCILEYYTNAPNGFWNTFRSGFLIKSYFQAAWLRP